MTRTYTCSRCNVKFNLVDRDDIDENDDDVICNDCFKILVHINNIDDWKRFQEECVIEKNI